MPTADERARYAETLLKQTALIVGAVHDLGPEDVAASIDQALSLPAPDDVDPVHALATILAAQVNPSMSHEQTLTWTRPLQPVTAPAGVRPQVDASFVCDVQAAMSGRIAATSVSKPARLEAVRQLAAQGYTNDEIARRLRITPRSVERLRAEGMGRKVQAAAEVAA